MGVFSIHPGILVHIVFVQFDILVGPDTNWVCAITVVHDPSNGTDIKNRGNSLFCLLTSDRVCMYILVIVQHTVYELRARSVYRACSFVCGNFNENSLWIEFPRIFFPDLIESMWCSILLTYIDKQSIFVTKFTYNMNCNQTDCRYANIISSYKYKCKKYVDSNIFRNIIQYSKIKFFTQMNIIG